MSKERIMGWETSRLMDEEQSFSDRARLSKKQVFALLASGLVFFLLYQHGLNFTHECPQKEQLQSRKNDIFGALAGFNKGIGGGRYGPVVTIVGLLAVIPAKTMMAALSEGTVCLVSIAAWLILMKNGVIIDFVLMPSMLMGSLVTVIAAPYATRVIPEKA